MVELENQAAIAGRFHDTSIRGDPVKKPGDLNQAGMKDAGVPEGRSPGSEAKQLQAGLSFRLDPNWEGAKEADVPLR